MQGLNKSKGMSLTVYLLIYECYNFARRFKLKCKTFDAQENFQIFFILIVEHKLNIILGEHISRHNSWTKKKDFKCQYTYYARSWFTFIQRSGTNMAIGDWNIMHRFVNLFTKWIL